MGIYSISFLFLGVLVIGFVFLRFDITKPKILIGLLISLTLYLIIFFSIHHHFQKTCTIIANESFSDIKKLILSWGIAAPLMSIILMIIQAIIAPLPAFLITAANGLVFGLYWGTIISWFGAMCGSLVSFMMSRLVFNNFKNKFLENKKGLEYINRISSKYGFKIILTSRLLPFISFDLISYAAGLSTIKIRSFILATGIGMLPATIVYTVFGFEMGKLKEYSDTFFTFSIIAVMVLIFIWIFQGIYRRRKSSSS